MLQRTRQFKFERLDLRTVRRINLGTLDEENLSHTPNAQGEYINVPMFVARRLENSQHAIFGEPGREVWYGGDTNYSNDTLSRVWGDIETHSVFREVDFSLWPVGTDDVRVHFCCSIDDFIDAEASLLVAPEYNDSVALDLEDKEVAISGVDDPKIAAMDLRLVKMRARNKRVVWRDLSGLSIGTQNDIANLERSVDIREAVTFQRSQIVSTKSRLEVG